jgi:transcriptional regulator with XRE-family HTH domain
MKTNQFALRLNRLFKEKTRPDGREYSQTEVLDELQGVITRVYLWKLRNGRAANPSLNVIQGLADFFAVKPNYFFEEDAESTGSPFDLAYEIQLKVADLEPEQQQIVLYMIDALQKSHKKG